MTRPTAVPDTVVAGFRSRLEALLAVATELRDDVGAAESGTRSGIDTRCSAAWWKLSDVVHALEYAVDNTAPYPAEEVSP